MSLPLFSPGHRQRVGNFFIFLIFYKNVFKSSFCKILPLKSEFGSIFVYMSILVYFFCLCVLTKIATARDFCALLEVARNFCALLEILSCMC